MNDFCRFVDTRKTEDPDKDKVVYRMADPRDEPSLEDEDAVVLARRVGSCLERAATLTKSLDLDAMADRFLRSIWCFTMLRRKLFPRYCDGALYVGYIYNGSGALLLKRLGGTVEKILRHTVDSAKESERMARETHALRNKVWSGKMVTIKDWRIGTRGLTIPTGNHREIARLLAEAFDIAILHPTYALHASHPKHPIWQLEEQMTAVSLDLNEIERLARTTDADLRLAYNAMESATTSMERAMILGRAPNPTSTRDTTPIAQAGQGTAFTASAESTEPVPSTVNNRGQDTVFQERDEAGTCNRRIDGRVPLTPRHEDMASSNARDKEKAPVTLTQSGSASLLARSTWGDLPSPISMDEGYFPDYLYSSSPIMQSPIISSATVSKHRCKSFSGTIYLPDPIEEVRCEHYSENDHECDTHECDVEDVQINDGATWGGILSTLSQSTPPLPISARSDLKPCRARRFENLKVVTEGPWSAPLERTTDFTALLEGRPGSNSDEFTAPEGAVWGSAPFRKRTLTNSSGGSTNSPMTPTIIEFTDTGDFKRRVRSRAKSAARAIGNAKAKVKSKSRDDVGWHEVCLDEDEEESNTSSRNSPMLETIDKFVNLVIRRRENSL